MADIEHPDFNPDLLDKDQLVIDEEQTVIVDEIYLIRLQNENTSMRKALKQILLIEHDAYGMGDIRLAFITMADIAQKTLDKIGKPCQTRITKSCKSRRSSWRLDTRITG